MKPNEDIKQVLFTEQQIKDRAKEIATLIDKKYGDTPVTLVGILKGAYAFTADIAKAMHNPQTRVELMVVSSYKNDTSLKEVQVILDLKESAQGRHLILIEDIVDTGRTLAKIKSLLLERGAASVEIATMCTKPSRREFPINIDYPAFEVPNEHVIGYGLDYNEVYRFLPYIATMTKEAYEKYKK